MSTALKVGMIGVNAAGGWALEGHVPVVQALDGLELFAVASRSQENAERTAEATGATKAYGDPQALIADPEVDVVAVVSPVPSHRQWILAALAAGKHVLTEWPVTPLTPEAEEIARAADAAGVKTAVDLQARMSAAAEHAAELIRQGRVGRVLGTTVVSSTAAFGPEIPSAAAPLERREVGMNLRTIQFAHTLDFVARVVGPLASAQVVSGIQYPTVTVVDSDETITRTLPDRILLQGLLEDGSTVMVQTVGGRPEGDAPFRMEVQGTAGELTLSGGGPRGFQASAIRLHLDGGPVALPSEDGARVRESAQNVARVYAALRDDITTGSSSAPSFQHAARLAHRIDELARIGDTGERIRFTPAD